MNELLLYIRLEGSVVVDDGVAQAIGVTDKHALLALIRDAVAQQLVERWASLGEPVDLTGEGPLIRSCRAPARGGATARHGGDTRRHGGGMA